MAKTYFIPLICVAFLSAGCEYVSRYGGGAAKEPTKPFGTEADVRYAKGLWTELESVHMVGAAGISTVPYKGTHPHGAVLETLQRELSFAGNQGTVIVKRNYGGKGVSKDAVIMAPQKYLQAVTVMYRREGYDPDNQNWFWVKYGPNGEILENPKGALLAGRVAKGMNEGCIACHKGAPGSDYVFNHDRFAR